MKNLGEKNFVKFPKTKWLPLGKKPCGGEHCLNEKALEQLFSKEVRISEKLDGANVGISFIDDELRLQKRGGFIETREHPQYQAFRQWIYERYDKFSRLENDTVIFGEWLYAKHSIYYNRLPNYFFMFDVWKEGKFLTVPEWDELADRLDLYTVPFIFHGKLSVGDIPDLIKKSKYSDEFMEGIVVRNEDLRGKYVRPDFICGDEHWSKRKIIRNLIVFDQQFYKE